MLHPFKRRITSIAARYLFTVVRHTPNADGAFEFVGMRPGNYDIIVAHAGSFIPFGIVVADKDVTGVEISIVAPVVMRGMLVVEGARLRRVLPCRFNP